MKDKGKLIRLFEELTVFATPEKAARHFQENHVFIREYGDWEPTGMHLLPYQCSICESLEEGRTNFCPNCGADMRGTETVGALE